MIDRLRTSVGELVIQEADQEYATSVTNILDGLEINIQSLSSDDMYLDLSSKEEEEVYDEVGPGENKYNKKSSCSIM